MTAGRASTACGHVRKSPARPQQSAGASLYRAMQAVPAVINGKHPGPPWTTKKSGDGTYAAGRGSCQLPARQPAHCRRQRSGATACGVWRTELTEPDLQHFGEAMNPTRRAASVPGPARVATADTQNHISRSNVNPSNRGSAVTE